MGNLLEVLLPRLFPGLSFQCVPHEGKQDLEKSIPRKLKAWRVPGVFFCVIRDNDSGDCRALKERLIDEARRWLRCLSGALNALLPTPLPLPYVFWRSRPRRPSEDELEVMGLPTLTGCT